MVWDIYDGIRSGIADYFGEPHYFECIFDDQKYEYSNTFELKLIDHETLIEAQEQWSIYRTWEEKFHAGSESAETHPGRGGVSCRYDELERLVKEKLETMPVVASGTAVFQEKIEQPQLPDGCLREMEVEWL